MDARVTRAPLAPKFHQSYNTYHYPTPKKYKIVFRSSESEHMVWYKISFCDEDTHLSQAFAELQSISRCLSWLAWVWLENCREENYILLPPTKQCKNAADGGPGRIYVDGIFSRLIQGILMSTRLDLKKNYHSKNILLWFSSKNIRIFLLLQDCRFLAKLYIPNTINI